MEDLFVKVGNESENTPIIGITETEKDWSIVAQVNNWEDFFLDENNFLPVIHFAKDRARNLIADPNTKEGQIARKSLAKKIGQVEKAIAERGLEVARILKEKPKKIDAVRKKVKDTLLSYKDEVLAPLKEIEARKAEIVEIDNLPAQGIGCDSFGLKQLLERLEALAKTPEYWKESAYEAEIAVRDAQRQLSDMLAGQEKIEAEKRELEELRAKREEMERLAREKAEAELKKAQEEAAKAKAEAEKIAKEKEEAERKQKEAEELAQKAETARQEAEAQIPEWKKNEIPKEQLLWPEDEKERKRKINREALEAMTKLTAREETMAKAIITAIAKEQVPHIFIDYGIRAVDYKN